MCFNYWLLAYEDLEMALSSNPGQLPILPEKSPNTRKKPLSGKKSPNQNKFN